MIKEIYILFDKIGYKQLLIDELNVTNNRTFKAIRDTRRSMILTVFACLIFMGITTFLYKVPILAYLSYIAFVLAVIYFVTIGVMLDKRALNQRRVISLINNNDFSWDNVKEAMSAIITYKNFYFGLSNVLLNIQNKKLVYNGNSYSFMYKEKSTSKFCYRKLMTDEDCRNWNHGKILLLRNGVVQFCSMYEVRNNEYVMHFTISENGDIVLDCKS